MNELVSGGEFNTKWGGRPGPGSSLDI